MFILFYRQRFQFKNLFTTRFWLRWITKTASQSHWHHVDHTLPYVIGHSYFSQNGMISQAHSPVYRHVFWLDYFKEMGSVDVYAREVIKEIDFDKLEKSEKYCVGKGYDVVGAASSESHGLIKQESNDDQLFCSEADEIMCEEQGWVNKGENTNKRSPQEYDELIIDRKIVEDQLILVWDGRKKEVVNNIFGRYKQNSL